jgi:hypothetical protein
VEGSPPSPVFLLLSVALEHPALHHLHTLRRHALLRHCTAPEPDRQRGGALCGGTVQPHTPARWFFLRRQHRPAPPGADQQGCGGVRWRGNPPRGSERTCGLLVLWCWWHGMAWHSAGTRNSAALLLGHPCKGQPCRGNQTSLPLGHGCGARSSSRGQRAQARAEGAEAEERDKCTHKQTNSEQQSMAHASIKGC